MGLNPADGLVALVSLLASTVGAVCGVGGGILIKPVLDAVSSIDVATVNFLSGATVLSMTAYSVARSIRAGSGSMDLSRDTPLAVGAAFGGLAGKQLFSAVSGLFGNPDRAGAVQAAVLCAVTAGALAYTLAKDRVATRHVESRGACVAIGLALGTCSSFLGIGGGPINLVVLFYFFSMDTKRAAASSLYIILFSQTVSTAASLLTQDLSAVNPAVLALMAACGIAGGALGRRLNARVDARFVDRLFVALMVVIIFINVYNLAAFGAVRG